MATKVVRDPHAARRDAGTADAVDAQIIEEYSTSESLERLLTETGAGIDSTKVHVYLINSETREEPKIWSGSTDDYDLDALAKQFGSGRYRVKAYGPHPVSEKYAMLLNQVIPCMVSPEEDAAIKARREGRALPGEAQPITREQIAALIAESQRALQPAVTPLQSMREMAEVMRMMMPPAPVAPAAPPLDPFTLIKSLSGIMRDLQPERRLSDEGVNAGPFDMLTTLIEKFGPAFMDAMKAQQSGGVQPALAGPAVYPAVQPGVQSAAPGAAQTMEEQVTFRLKMGLAFLVQQAGMDNDPGTYAAMIVDNVPPEELKLMLAAPDWIDRLAVYEPEVKKHPKWFDELKTEVADELEQRAKPKPDAEPAP